MGISKTTKIKLGKYDKIWGYMVRGRDKACLVCGEVERIAAHHYEGRAKKSTRFMLENGITLCPKHHVFDHNFSAHKTPKDFKAWFAEAYPTRARAVKEKVQTTMSERAAVEEFKVKYNL